MKRPKAPTDREGLPKWKGAREVRRIKFRNMALRLAKIPCGKHNCSRCPHGPYWYFVTWRGKKATQRYIGKFLFGKKTKRAPDLEANILHVLEGAGEKVAGKEFTYEPTGVDCDKFIA